MVGCKGIEKVGLGGVAASLKNTQFRKVNMITTTDGREYVCDCVSGCVRVMKEGGGNGIDNFDGEREKERTRLKAGVLVMSLTCQIGTGGGGIYRRGSSEETRERAIHPNESPRRKIAGGD